MGKKEKIPSTPALRLLRSSNIAHEVHTYTWTAHGGTGASAAALGVDEHAVIKTLILEDEEKKPLVMLMHGDRAVSEQRLARAIGRRTVAMCAPETAERHTGYQVGGTSPFGLRKPLPIFVESSVLELPQIWINGGARGVLVSLVPGVLVGLLGAKGVQAERA